MNDPVSDFLTRVRNASRARKAECVVPHSRLKSHLADILLKEGFVSEVGESQDGRGHKTILIGLKYVDGVPAISGLDRVSKPGRRMYARHDEIPRVLNGLGIAIVSTSKGLMKDRDARRNRVGGEILCNVW